MSPEAATSKPRGRRTLNVVVRLEPGASHPVHVRPITLTNSIARVVWRCPGLPPGARLQILFADDPRGPFFSLEESGGEVIGLGNRGPDDTSRKYAYTVKVGGGTHPPLQGPGRLTNHATEPLPGSIDPPDPEPPKPSPQ